MPGSYSDNRTVQLVGEVFFLIAMVGSVVYDLEFGGSADPLPSALAVLAVAIAIAVTVLRNR